MAHIYCREARELQYRRSLRQNFLRKGRELVVSSSSANGEIKKPDRILGKIYLNLSTQCLLKLVHYKISFLRNANLRLVGVVCAFDPSTWEVADGLHRSSRSAGTTGYLVSKQTNHKANLDQSFYSIYIMPLIYLQ